MVVAVALQDQKLVDFAVQAEKRVDHLAWRANKLAPPQGMLAVLELVHLD